MAYQKRFKYFPIYWTFYQTDVMDSMNWHDRNCWVAGSSNKNSMIHRCDSSERICLFTPTTCWRSHLLSSIHINMGLRNIPGCWTLKVKVYMWPLHGIQKQTHAESIVLPEIVLREYHVSGVFIIICYNRLTDFHQTFQLYSYSVIWWRWQNVDIL